MTIDKKILIVDDEINLLRSLQRNLRKLYDLTIAEGGLAGLSQILEGGPFAVIVSGLQMPEVDGLQVLELARIVTPDSVRIMLTGNVKGETPLLGAENKAWFRYVYQPCATDRLCQILNEAISEHEMAIATKQIRPSSSTANAMNYHGLQQRPQLATNRNDVLGRSQRLRHLSRRLGKLMNLSETWRYELAGMLSQISQLAEINPAHFPNEGGDDKAVLKRQAESSSDIIRRIPRLEFIADMVGLQYSEEIPSNLAEFVKRGSQILRMLTDYDILIETMSPIDAICQMKVQSSVYGIELFRKFSELISSAHACPPSSRIDLAVPSSP